MNKKHIYILSIIIFGAGFSSWWMHSRIKGNAELEKLARSLYVPFDASMQSDAYAGLLHKQAGSQTLMTFFKDLYNRNPLNKVTIAEQPHIPKIIHHIWMGSPMREKDKPCYESWLKFHPEWTFIFWTDNAANYDKGDIVVYSFEEVEKLLADNKNDSLRIVVDINKLQFANRAFFDESINYGERGDILDYEIVYRFGGVYVDCDFECYKPLDIFHHAYDFYTGIQPLDTNRVQLGAALFGAIPHHPILAGCVEDIKNYRHIPQIIVKTGPIYFTREFYKIAGRSSELKDIALPASYFYPCGYEQRMQPKDVWCKNESFAVHHWAGSWLEPAGFVKKALARA
ncbi:MAG TPA: glycosyltransferase [Candidatus Dependentiae bacterium]|nr:glycosyltransferase [Candidatus Dependentiae bacterium]HRQ63098.1 glycosyltransferase [Candidatus Dependentiae bacterium]